MGGDVSLTSDLGKGTTILFKVTSQFAKQDKSKEVKTSKKGLENFKDVRVLVAEDNIINQRIITKFLKRFNNIPVVVENGKLAVDAATKEDFDVIFMDYQMPVINGMEAVKAILELPDRKAPIIVAVSANALSEDRNLFLNSGFNYVLSKPYTLNEFSDLISKLSS